MASSNTACSKCNGLGKIAAYAHRDNGECYRCKGTGVDPIPRARRAAPQHKPARAARITLTEVRPGTAEHGTLYGISKSGRVYRYTRRLTEQALHRSLCKFQSLGKVQTTTAAWERVR